MRFSGLHMWSQVCDLIGCQSQYKIKMHILTILVAVNEGYHFQWNVGTCHSPFYCNIICICNSFQPLTTHSAGYKCTDDDIPTIYYIDKSMLLNIFDPHWRYQIKQEKNAISHTQIGLFGKINVLNFLPNTLEINNHFKWLQNFTLVSSQMYYVILKFP